jgi:hypothetical protein
MFNWFNNTWLNCFAQFTGHFILCPEGLVRGELHAQVDKLSVDTNYSVNTTPAVTFGAASENGVSYGNPRTQTGRNLVEDSEITNA